MVGRHLPPLVTTHPDGRAADLTREVAPLLIDPLARLRALCTVLPEATEKLSHGEPTWLARKVFVMYADHHHDDRVGFWCAAPPGAQEALVAARPEAFFRPPYVGHRGWLGVYLDIDVDWVEIAEIIEDAYRQVAPKRLVARLDVLPRAGDGGGRQL